MQTTTISPDSHRPAPLLPAGGNFAVIGRVVLFWICAVVLVYGGVALRSWLYPASADHRFTPDIQNAWTQGAAVIGEARSLQGNAEPITWRSFFRAYLNRYDMAIKGRGRGPMVLDYPPARLLIAALWVWHEGGDSVAAPRFLARLMAPLPEPHELAAPLLTLNTLFGLAGAAAGFLIVHHVLGRKKIPHREFIALLAATLVWFNLPMLLDSHVWPQWDVWVLPFYLFAAYFGLTRRWTLAGICLGLGTMFKGQVLCTMALFVLWPLFQMRWRAVLEVVAGALLGAMLLAWPWMLRTAWAWVFFVAMLLLIGGGTYFLPRKWRTLFICGTVPLTLLLCGWCFDGSFAWWQRGIAYGSYHYMRLTMGRPNNLANLLATRFGWKLQDVVFTLGGVAVTLRAFMVSIYAIALVLCAMGLARHDAQNDRRMLIALAAPWVVMFAFLPQMHERYLVWGAAAMALAVGVSLGTTLLHLAISFLACLPIAIPLLSRSPHKWPALTQFVRASDPDSAWAVMLLAAIVLYLALTPGSDQRPAARTGP